MSSAPHRLGGLILSLGLLTLACGGFAPARPTPTPAPTATPVDLTASYRRWPVVLRDNFFEAANTWEVVEDADDRWARGSLMVANGKYRFDLTANEGFVWWSRALADTVTTDFYAAVDARQVSGTATADYGLIFHYAAGNYYYFAVSDTGQFAVSLYYREAWETLVDWTASAALLPGEVNTLAVAAEGDHYQVFINRAWAGEFTDQRLPQGEAGVAVEIYNAGDSAVFEFDNFEWRAPRAAVLPTVTPEP